MKIELKNITVLYCEDEPQLREVTRSFLSRVVKKVYIAKDGREGLTLFRAHSQQIDMVISDIAMPLMDGLEMAAEIKKIIPKMPVIIVTAYSSAGYLRGALDLHVDKYILKPLNLKDLISVMEQSLTYHELRGLYRDPVTGLQTGIALRNDLRDLPAERCFALIRTDDVERLSDLYGETLSTRIMIEVSGSIKKAFGGDYTCYRVAPNLFALLALETSVTAESLEERLRKFSSELRYGGIVLDDTTVRIGSVTVFSTRISDRVLEFGVQALKRAIETHMPLYEFRGDRMEKRPEESRNIEWVRRLDSALEEGRLKPYFQAIVGTESQESVKYEALLRFVDETKQRVVTPDHFLEIARRANIYPLITRRMLDEAIRVIRKKKIRITLNIAYADITDPDTMAYIREILTRYPDEVKRIEFEILESENIDNYAIAKRFIETVRSYGVRVGIDDFGKGYSNFGMLEALDVDYVKIDGSLIQGIDRSKRQAIVVKGIHTFCQRLGVDTVAEKVSNASEYRVVKAIGIEYAQGWYFSKAVPAEELQDG